jgi:hypothetical protein
MARYCRQFYPFLRRPASQRSLQYSLDQLAFYIINLLDDFIESIFNSLTTRRQLLGGHSNDDN